MTNKITALYAFLLFAAVLLSPSSAQNYWQGLNLPNTDAITAVTFNQLGHVFCATRNSGIYRSTNGGTTFTQINTGLANQKILAVACLSNSELLAGSIGNGFYHSLNNGDNWSEYGGLITPATVTSILVRPSLPLLAGTFGGLFASSNGGAFWTNFKTGISKDSINCIATNAAGNIFAGSSRAGVFRSTNAGTSFTKYMNGLPNIEVICLAVQTDGSIFCGTDGSGMYKSTDNGINWSKVTLPGNAAVVRAMFYTSSNKLLAAFGTGLYRTADGGATWTAISALSSVSVTAINQTTTGTILAGCWGGRLFASVDDGANWSNNWLWTKVATVHSLYIRPGTTSMYAGVLDDGLFFSSDKGGNWSHLSIPTIRFNPLDVKSIIYTSAGSLIIGTELFGMYRSTDGGNAWLPDNAGIAGAAIYGYALVQKSNGNIFLGTGGGGVYKSTDDGVTWSTASVGLTNPLLTCLAVTPAGNLLAGTGNGGVFRSTDNGASWSAVNNGLTNKAVNTLLFNSDGQAFVGTSGDGLFTSTNEGGVWAKVSPVVTTNAVMNNAVNSLGYLFIGTTGGGVYRSKDKGGTWSQINGGLASGSGRNVNALAIDKDGFIYAGTDGGVFASLASTTLTIPAISTSATTLAFGTVQVNSTGNKQCDITNTGDGSLVIDAISIIPTGLDFKTTLTAPVTIPPGGKTTLPVTFTPKAVGAQNASVQIHSNDPAKPTVTVALSGTGSATPKPKIVITATQLDFGTVVLPGTKRLSIHVENQGTAQLSITAIAFSGTNASLFSATPSVPLNIAAGGVDSILVDYNPTVKGASTAQIDITHNDSDKGTISIPLSGQAVNPGSLAGAPGSIDFGKLLQADPTQTRTIRFENPGDVAVTIQKQQLQGTNASNFQLTKLLPGSLSGPGTDSITVSFQPAAATWGVKSATLVVESDGVSGKHIEIQLSAEVINPVSVEPIAPVGIGGSSNYPNPFDRVTTVSFAGTGTGRLLIFDLLGKQVLDATGRIERAEEGRYRAELRSTDFPHAGVYLYRILLTDVSGRARTLSGKICLLR